MIRKSQVEPGIQVYSDRGLAQHGDYPEFSPQALQKQTRNQELLRHELEKKQGVCVGGGRGGGVQNYKEQTKTPQNKMIPTQKADTNATSHTGWH